MLKGGTASSLNSQIIRGFKGFCSSRFKSFPYASNHTNKHFLDIILKSDLFCFLTHENTLSHSLIVAILRLSVKRGGEPRLESVCCRESLFSTEKYYWNLILSTSFLFPTLKIWGLGNIWPFLNLQSLQFLNSSYFL